MFLVFLFFVSKTSITKKAEYVISIPHSNVTNKHSQLPKSRNNTSRQPSNRRKRERPLLITRLTALVRRRTLFRLWWIWTKYTRAPHIFRIIIPSELVSLQPSLAFGFHHSFPVCLFFRFISNPFTHHSQRQPRFESRRHTSNRYGMPNTMDRSQCFQYILARSQTRQREIIPFVETSVEKDRYSLQRMIIASKAGRKSC